MITSVGARTADVPVLGDSIKRGAVDHLVCAKAAGAPFPEHLISRLAKHTADNVDPTLAQMTVRYTSDVVALARVLRSAEVTEHL
ncbi:hypothetical protein DIPPA_01828 [Diplonema papillatum]|nr:hypothetical protein DIPPA_01828 [Diplonema papillatum]